MGNNCLPTTMPAFKTIACRLVALLALFVTCAYVFLDPSLVGFCHTEIVMTQISSARSPRRTAQVGSLGQASLFQSASVRGTSPMLCR